MALGSGAGGRSSRSDLIDVIIDVEETFELDEINGKALISDDELVTNALAIGSMDHGVFRIAKLSSHPQGDYITSMGAKAAENVVTNWV